MPSLECWLASDVNLCDLDSLHLKWIFRIAQMAGLSLGNWVLFLPSDNSLSILLPLLTCTLIDSFAFIMTIFHSLLYNKQTYLIHFFPTPVLMRLRVPPVSLLWVALSRLHLYPVLLCWCQMMASHASFPCFLPTFCSVKAISFPLDLAL